MATDPVEQPLALVPPAASAAPQEPTSSPQAPLAPAETALPAEVAAPAAPASEAVAPATPELAPGLLEKFDKDAKGKDAEKPAEAEAPARDAKPEEKVAEKPAEKAAEAEKPGEEKPVAEVAAPTEPIVYDFKLPEFIKSDDPAIGAYTELLREQNVPAEVGQKFLDMHADALKSYDAAKTQQQYDVFNQTKADWEKQAMADEEIGGSGHLTAMGAIARVRDLTVSSAAPGSAKYNADAAEFENFLAVTGAGSHPAFLRMLHNQARYIDEPQSSSVPSNITPPKGNGKPPGGFKETMYGDSPSKGRQ